MVRIVVMGSLLFGVWLLWSGHYTLLTTSLGIGSCLLIVGLSIRMHIVDEEGQPVHLVTRLPGYSLWLMKEVVVSNVDVARRILHPRLPISPTMFVMKVGERSDLGQVIYANSITLTPGTITVRLRNGYVLVHALASKSEEELRIGEMGRRVARLEDGGS